MSWVRIWIHLVFSTKNRTKFITPEIKEQFLNHIKQNASEKNIWLDTINGHSDHIHCLISLNREQSISKIAQLIKGESSFWINKNNIIKEKFLWQDDFWTVSVSESHLEAVRKYIKEQEEHHMKKTFVEELSDFMKKYRWEIVNN